MPPYVKKALILAYDVIFIQLAAFLALWVRFEFDLSAIPTAYLDSYFLSYAVVNTLITLVLFKVFRLYGSIWVFAGAAELLNAFLACAGSCVGLLIGFFLLNLAIPSSFYIMYFGFLFAGVAGVRISFRLLRHFKRLNHNRASGMKRIMLVGAGNAGNVIMREIMESDYVDGSVECCIDDCPTKKGKYLCGVKIVGGRDHIVEAAKKYNIDEIIVAVPSAPSKSVSEILDVCKNTGCKIKILPGIYQLINGEAKISDLRDVQIEDLLGRDPIKVNEDEIAGFVKNKVILVTGGGGSIGSELCRQIARCSPRLLIILDIYENNAYEIQQELLQECPDIHLDVLIASVRDFDRMREVFAFYRPEVVYHAAAHKHVPLMEHNPNEAIKNNVFGTLNVVKAAGEHGVKRFVLISTDKAVNPTNIMGASKRMCEMIVQMMNGYYNTEFVAVRFGNVLGSNGSVIPHFEKQIASGGPVTVTHRDVIRYFMTIREAVSLVLQAGVYAQGGEIFILDMGEPVRIDDLARNLIRLHGYVPDVDIEVVYTGLRPGEKLYEEILLSEEGQRMTENELIYVANPIEFDNEVFNSQLEELAKIIYDTEDVRSVVLRTINGTAREKHDRRYVFEFKDYVGESSGIKPPYAAGHDRRKQAQSPVPLPATMP